MYIAYNSSLCELFMYILGNKDEQTTRAPATCKHASSISSHPKEKKNNRDTYQTNKLIHERQKSLKKKLETYTREALKLEQPLLGLLRIRSRYQKKESTLRPKTQAGVSFAGLFVATFLEYLLSNKHYIPILLQHFPLYKPVSSAARKIRNTKYQQRW